MTSDIAEEISDMWSTRSYAEFAKSYLPMAIRLVETTAVDSSDDVLDVGCGTGNVAITAARRGARVTGLDITPDRLDRARENVGFDGIEWREGDATDLSFEENTFDVTLSNLGHMYGDPPADAARELIRVTRPGGRIGFTSWTPTGIFPMMAGHVAAHLDLEDQPGFSEPPFMWGDRDVVEQRVGATVDDLHYETRTVAYPALSPGHFWQEVITHSGMFITFLDKVENRSTLQEKIIETIVPYFDASENAVELEYLLTTATVSRSD